ncbi:unnamed protein product [Triticum turgidum subsp. durum]|uniref:Small ribosomal subunit protein mS23 n=1 Tax=Triticum turgidum subsp. durum TaxID=4567 RepID=A0A9R0TL15_TRITD|nr:unnamed protein product [Triticum turgidum subsp. durum]
MSYMRGDLLTKTRKLVKGLAKPAPAWLKAMEQAPPVTFPRTDGKIEKIELPEDVYVKRFFRRHPDSLYHDAIKISGFDPPPARVFAWRVLELKEQGVNEDDAMAVADDGVWSREKSKEASIQGTETNCTQRRKATTSKSISKRYQRNTGRGKEVC